MKWFINCKTVEEAKVLYKDLAKKYHPDIAGTEHTATMQEINNEFEEVYNYLKAHAKSDTKTAYNVKNCTETPKEFIDIIDKLISCEGLVIELVGRWIWITGNTYAYKDILKALAFRWSGKKKAWYWRKDEDGGKNYRHTLTLDEIKEKYGCQSFVTAATPKLA